jgi:hypothetical protein
MTAQTLQRVIWRDEIRKMLDNISSDGLRKLIKAKRFPPADVVITNRTMGWNTSTLLEKGFKLPDEPAPEASPVQPATPPSPSSSAS